MKQSPSVTIVIPTYNAQKTIKDTIESVLNQSYKNITLYIVDDCSTDNTIQIIESLKENNIHIVKGNQNIGFCANWNRCLDFIEGDFFKLLPHDDTLERRSVEKMVELLLSDDSLVMVGSLRNIIDDNNKIVMKRGKLVNNKHICNYKSFIITLTKMATNPLGEPGSILFKSEIIKKNNLKFSDNYELFIDVDFYMKVLKFGECYLINEHLYNFRVWTNSYSVEHQKQQLCDTKSFFQEKIYQHTFLNSYALLLNKINIYKNFFLKRLFYMFVVR